MAVLLHWSLPRFSTAEALCETRLCMGRSKIGGSGCESAYLAPDEAIKISDILCARKLGGIRYRNSRRHFVAASIC
jgi:hypothetical protein